ncbi:MAG TPA: hypothetical protein DCY94_03175 [Firmicutes bacterium]|nr:hypothetical protein [Bacillota bacterium]
MNNKTKNVILLAISGVFLVVASVLVTYTVMNYITFAAKVEKGEIPSSSKVEEPEEKREPLSSSEMNEFVTALNTQIVSNFLSSVSFLKPDDLRVSNSNLLKYVYPLFEGCASSGNGTMTITKDSFLSSYYNLVGQNLTDEVIESSALWSTEEQIIKFVGGERSMEASITIDSSYKIDDDYYFDINIENNIYGSMKRSIALKRNAEYKYSFIYIKSTN